MTRHGYDRFFALRPGGARAFGEDSQTFFHRWIVGLEVDHAPSTFYQRCAQARVTVFGHTARYSFAAAAVFART